MVISACTEPGYQSENTTDKNESILTEYIIVLKENVSISIAIGLLEKYEVQVIKDLKKNRYLIGLKNDPGLEQLKKEVEATEYIEQIQPNFSYTIQ